MSVGSKCIVFVACVLGVVANADEPTWPAFLGAGANGVGSGELPTKWSKTEGVRWKVPLVGHGQSSPCAFGDNLYVTTVDGNMKDEFLVYNLDLQTGEVRWMKRIKNSTPVTNSIYVSRAAPTPVVDKDQVVAFFESGDCVAYDHQGGELWQRDLGKDYGPFVAEFGLGASPCQTSSAVFVLLEHSGPNYLIALDKKTGETLWKTERWPRKSWSSPARFVIDGVEQIVVSSAGSVDGYDAANGKLLWTMDGVGGNTGVTPIDNGSGTFLIGGSAGRQAESESLAAQSNGLVSVKLTDVRWEVKKVWINDKVSTSWASPIVHNGLAYWVSRVGVVTCMDVATGEVLFNERLGQSCWATPIGVKDRIYFFGKEGLTTIIKSDRKFEKIAENPLLDPESLPPETTKLEQETTAERRQASAMFSGPTLYAAIMVGNKIVARIGNQVYCVE
jgi:outer membrane protein assembly factor BamB